MYACAEEETDVDDITSMASFRENQLLYNKWVSHLEGVGVNNREVIALCHTFNLSFIVPILLTIDFLLLFSNTGICISLVYRRTGRDAAEASQEHLSRPRLLAVSQILKNISFKKAQAETQGCCLCLCKPSVPKCQN